MEMWVYIYLLMTVLFIGECVAVRTGRRVFGLAEPLAKLMDRFVLWQMRRSVGNLKRSVLRLRCNSLLHISRYGVEPCMAQIHIDITSRTQQTFTEWS